METCIIVMACSGEAGYGASTFVLGCKHPLVGYKKPWAVHEPRNPCPRRF